MADIREMYLESCRVALDLIAHADVADRWTAPSILPELSTGALAAHLGRALVTVDAYLEADVTPATDSTNVDAAGYFVAVLGDHDPMDSDFHRGVRERSATAAGRGRDDVIGALRVALERLNGMPDDMGRPIAVLAGLQMELGEYLKTRLVELAVHGRDLADSVGAEPADAPPGCWEVVAEVVAAVAIQRNEPSAVALCLARADRFPRVTAF